MTASKKKPVKATGAKTNKKKGSLVKTIVLEDSGKWVRPNSGEKFFIDEDAKFPAIVFEIDTTESGPYDWSWELSWPATVSGLRESEKRGKALKTFSEKGKFNQTGKNWAVDFSGKIIGGTLTVQVKIGNVLFKRSVYIKGKNPGEERVKQFLNTLEDVKGFDKLVEQESTFKNFINADNLPVVAFDGGYGMTQMTKPAPSFVQIWNWKENIKAGSALYKEKQKLAKAYLSKHNRTYTDEQLKLETWSLWNGGNYHVWDEKNKIWVRNPNILADTATGNIGWDTRREENKNKTEAELHERDKEQYKKPPKKSNRKWDYSGVVYADHVNH